MNFFRILFFSFLIILFVFEHSFADTENSNKGIAVIKGKFDKIEKILKRYRIPFTEFEYMDLENKSIYNDHRAIFFPCGAEIPIDTNINILSRGTQIKSVKLKKDFQEINEDKIASKIKSYIKKGGNAYFSGYSYKLLNKSLESMTFYNNFPNIGMVGKILLNLKDDLRYFCKKIDLRVYMPHPGWVVVKSISNSKTLAESSFETITGNKSSPILSILKRGDGEAIYTSYHKTRGNDDLQRFLIYRISYKFLLDKLHNDVFCWEQNINCSIIDSVREWEKYRSYIVPFKKGENTLYFLSEKGQFQINIYDKDNNFIASRDSRKNNFDLDLDIQREGYYILKVFPGNPKRSGAYSIISANGTKIIPYLKKSIYFLLSIIIIFVIIMLKRTFGPIKYSGRIKQK